MNREGKEQYEYERRRHPLDAIGVVARSPVSR